ncbi:MAG: dockerin type I domain-containing protein, partial [Pirellulales bacterium]
TAVGVTGPAFGSDFNGDGIVDIQDLLIWRASFPIASGALGSEGDADGDGDVDGIDFMIWQTKNGGPPVLAAAAAVPEPAAGLLLMLGTIFLGSNLRGPTRRRQDV